MTDSVDQTTMPLLPPSPGALIKRAREQAGVHIAAMAVNLKVSVKQLEALEADDFDKLSEPVFARALAAKVCRLLKMDAAPVLALMPAATNGLKPLNIIGADSSNRVQHYQADHRLLKSRGGFNLGWFAILVFAIAASLYGQEILSLVLAKPEPTVVEVMPALPAVQEAPPTEAPHNPDPNQATAGQTPSAMPTVSSTNQPSANLGVSAPMIVSPESNK
jgi:cytoskeleton protein RodZ